MAYTGRATKSRKRRAFSTFSLETLELIEGGQYAIAGAYALVSVVLCVAGVLVGKVLARALMPTG